MQLIGLDSCTDSPMHICLASVLVFLSDSLMLTLSAKDELEHYSKSRTTSENRTKSEFDSESGCR
jgi:hypothetical protein